MLTDIKARAAKPAEKVYRLYDGGGMYLEVPPSGNKRRVTSGGGSNTASTAKRSA